MKVFQILSQELAGAGARFRAVLLSLNRGLQRPSLVERFENLLDLP
jgi:hypothetical protein